jgi:fatty acid desaturase
MNRAEMKRPNLPRDLYESSATWATIFILYGVGLFVGCGWLAGHVAAIDAPLALRIAGVLLLLLASAHGAHLMGFVGHEGIHLTLHRNKYVSAILGTLVSSMTSFSAIGYGISHWNHHRFTNQESDPDAHIYPRFKSFWRRLLLARSVANRTHVRNMVMMALGRPLALGYKLPFGPRASRALAALNLAFLALWLCLYAAIAVHHPLRIVFGVVLPLLIVIPLSGLRGYIEHGGTGIGIFRDTRSYVSPVYTWLLFGNNFHLEHHLYPGVPCYRLPAVHRFLKEGGYFARCASHIDTTIRGPLAHTTGATQYPTPLGPDLAHDPFRPAASPARVPVEGARAAA